MSAEAEPRALGLRPLMVGLQDCDTLSMQITVGAQHAGMCLVCARVHALQCLEGTISSDARPYSGRFCYSHAVL